MAQRLPAPPTASAKLGIAIAVAAAGALGAFGALAGEPDPVRFLVWLSVVSLAGGVVAGGLGANLFPYGLAAPGLWMIALVVVDGRAVRDVPAPHWSALAWTGLFAAGTALGVALRRAGGGATWAGAGAALLAAGLLVVLPGRAAWAERPWPPAAARALLDLSPATLVVESGGIDWMRHASVYDPVGTDRFERTPYHGPLAGPLVLLVGCLLAAGASLAGRRQAG